MNYIEMSKLAADPERVRALATYLRKVLEGRLTSAQKSFLGDLEKFKGPQPLSMRQREFLHSLRSRATRRMVVQGFRASTLIRKLWENRFDLDEGDEEFLVEKYEAAQKFGLNFALSEPEWRYTFRLARQLGESGATVEHRVLPAGHGLGQSDIGLLKGWLAGL